MLDDFFLRAGNRIAPYEETLTRSISSLTSESRAELLAAMGVSSFNSDVELLAWQDFGPKARDILRSYHVQVLHRTGESLRDCLTQYELLVCHEMLRSGWEFTERPWTNSDFKAYDDLQIEGKNWEVWLSDVVDAMGKRILALTHSPSIAGQGVQDYVGSASALIDDTMRVLDDKVSLNFQSFSAEWMRHYNSVTSESFGEALVIAN